MTHPLVLAGVCMLLALLCAVSGQAQQRGETSFTLVRDGEANATIVLATRPTRAAQFAAYELQWHVREMTGVTLSIVKEGQPVTGVRILIGESATTQLFGYTGKDFDLQEYVITTLPNSLVLMGRDKADFGEVDYNLDNWQKVFTTWPSFWDEQATMYAVYDFLERCCGVRWLNASETGTVIPKRRTLTVNVPEVRREPFFRFRGGTFAGDICENYDAAVSLWHSSTDGFARYEKAAHANLRAQYPDNWQYSHAKRARNRLFLHRMRVGGEKCNVNHSLYNFYDRFWEKDPNNPDIFVEKKPDWFAQGYPEGTPPQLCYTNPGLIKQVAQDARDYFDKGGYPQKPGKGLHAGYHWGENFFAVEPMDNGSFCKCAECQKLVNKDSAERTVYSTGRDSDYFFHFVNEVWKEVKKTHPHKRVATLAYMTHALPPKTFKLDPEVVVQFCFASNRNVWCPKEYQNDLAALRAWAEEDPDRPLYLWLYYTFPLEIANNGKFHCFPGFFAHKIDEQFKLFHQYGIKGMFHCGYGQEVEAYVTYKLMDDPTQSVDAILNDYFTGLYGEAAGPMRKLYEEIEKTYVNSKNYPAQIANGSIGSHQTVEFAWKYLGTGQRMAAFRKLMEEATQLAADDMTKSNVNLFDLGVWQYMETGRNNYVTRMTAPIPALTAPRVNAAQGDVSKVDWTKAAELGGTWYDRGQANPAKRRFSGRIAHDGQYVYLELTDPCDTAKIVTSAGVYPFDDWEIFIAKQRAQPFRQVAVGPTGTVVVGSHGEVNWRQNVPIHDSGITAKPEMQPDKWITRIAMPMATMLHGGLTPGEKLYLNVIRVTSPEINGAGLGIDTWVSYCTVKEPDRLAEITLE